MADRAEATETQKTSEMQKTPETSEAAKVIVYGSGWCPATRIVCRRLDLWHVSYRYVDVDTSPEAEERIAGWNNGRAIRPTLDVFGDILVAPDPVRLKDLLTQRGAL